MILEHARFFVAEHEAEAFVSCYSKARELLLAAPGCRSATLRRGVEHRGSFLLLVEWDTLEDHLEGFRESASFVQWRGLLGPYFVAAPEVEHYAEC